METTKNRVLNYLRRRKGEIRKDGDPNEGKYLGNIIKGVEGLFPEAILLQTIEDEFDVSASFVDKDVVLSRDGHDLVRLKVVDGLVRSFVVVGPVNDGTLPLVSCLTDVMSDGTRLELFEYSRVGAEKKWAWNIMTEGYSIPGVEQTKFVRLDITPGAVRNSFFRYIKEGLIPELTPLATCPKNVIENYQNTQNIAYIGDYIIRENGVLYIVNGVALGALAKVNG